MDPSHENTISLMAAICLCQLDPIPGKTQPFIPRKLMPNFILIHKTVFQQQQACFWHK